MGDSVAAVRAKHPHMKPGDAFALNAPYAGGTHLPDVTVVMPVFGTGETQPRSRTVRHAVITPISAALPPGSMPPFSTTVTDEGQPLDGLRSPKTAILTRWACARHWPTTPIRHETPDQNIADLCCPDRRLRQRGRRTEPHLHLSLKYPLTVILSCQWVPPCK